MIMRLKELPLFIVRMFQRYFPTKYSKNPNCHIDYNGNRFWTDLQGRWHREDGPAIERVDGSKEWFTHGLLHREDGPARIGVWAPNDDEWWVNGKRHRLDGPAIMWSDGTKAWYIDDKPVRCNSQEEFERLIKLDLFW